MKLKSDLSIRSAAQLVSFALRVLEDGNLHAKEEQFLANVNSRSRSNVNSRSRSFAICYPGRQRPTENNAELRAVFRDGVSRVPRKKFRHCM